MPTLNIGGRRVTVSDEFLKLSPEEQDATVDEIALSFPTGLERLQQAGERFSQTLEAARAKPYTGPLPKAPTFGMPSLFDVGLGLYRAATGAVPAVAEVAAGKRPLALPGTPGAVEPGTPGAVGPETVAEAASLLLPPSPAAGTGALLARGGMPVPQPMAQRAAGIGVNVPRGITSENPVVTSSAMAASRIPLGGGALRKSAAQGLEELSQAGEAAMARPTGVAVEPVRAGEVIRNSIGGAISRQELSADRRLVNVVRQTDEGALGSIITMAGSGNKADSKTLAKVRQAVSSTEWPKVQSAAIQRLGMKEERFDPALFVRNYDSLSKSGRNVLFAGKEGLARHLDDIADVSREYGPGMRRMAAPPGTLGTMLGFGALTAAAAGTAAAPLTVLQTLAGAGLVTRWLSKSSTAAPMARWARAYDSLIHRPGAASIASFRLATKNLSNNTGYDFEKDFEKLGITFKRPPIADSASSALSVIAAPYRGTYRPPSTPVTPEPLPPFEE